MFNDYFHIPKSNFGIVFGLVAIAFIVGNFLSAKLNTLLSSKKLTICGGLLILSGGSLMQITSQRGLPAFIVTMSIVCFGAANVIGAGTASALKAFNDASGKVSSMLGCFQFSFASSIGTLVMLYPANSIFPLSYMLITLGMICLMTHCVGLNNLKSSYLYVLTKLK